MAKFGGACRIGLRLCKSRDPKVVFEAEENITRVYTSCTFKKLEEY